MSDAMEDARRALAKLDDRLDSYDPDTLGDDPEEFDRWLELKNARDSLAAKIAADRSE